MVRSTRVELLGDGRVPTEMLASTFRGVVLVALVQYLALRLSAFGIALPSSAR